MTAPAKNVVAQPSVAEGAKPLHERIAEYLDRRDSLMTAHALLREAAEALRYTLSIVSEPVPDSIKRMDELRTSIGAPEHSCQHKLKCLFLLDRQDEAIDEYRHTVDNYSEALRNAETAKKDAARYQWLRKNWVQLMPHDCDGPEYMKLEWTWSDWPKPHRTLDAAIDAALSTAKADD